MLRITLISGPNAAPTLKIEGKLLGPWVAELRRACGEWAEVGSLLSLDLAAVTFVDGPGIKLLLDLRARGVTLAACSGLVAGLLHLEGK